MRRLKLGTILTALNVGLIVGALVAVVTASAIDLRRMADDQALARVRQAGMGARQAVRLAGEDLLSAARLLAERPNLQLLLVQDDRRALEQLLEGFRATGRLSGCAVLRGGHVVAATPAGLPWDGVATAAGADSEWFLGPRVGDAPFLLVGVARVASDPTATVATARLADRGFERDLSSQIGLPVALLGWREVSIESSDRAPLRQRALEAGVSVAERLESEGAYLALEPIAVRGGAPELLIETTLPTDAVDGVVHRLVGSVLIVGIVAGALAALLSVGLARRIVRPLRELARASARIGGGDLATPIPRPPGSEVGELATAMEEMRGRLLDLTAELRRRRADADAVLGGISEGVFAVDRQRRITYLNPQAAALLGIDAATAPGMFCGDLLNPTGPDGLRPCYDQCPILDARFRGGARATERLRLKDGRMRSVVIASAPPASSAFGDAADGLQFQVMRDETEVEATRRLRDAVLANITHEFRTPLSAQLASLELLRDRLSGVEEASAHDLLASLERGALRLTQLIDNLLESVRLDSGRDDIRHQPLALDEVIEEAATLTAPLLDLRRQRLEIDLPYPLPTVQGDTPRLVQVFVNLIANANKFAPADSVIRIGGQVSGSEVTVWVEDQGPGFPSESGVLLFEPFMRSPGEEPEQGGMGLGLYIVKSIVERHGGRVEARTTADSGARLVITLPRHVAAA